MSLKSANLFETISGKVGSGKIRTNIATNLLRSRSGFRLNTRVNTTLTIGKFRANINFGF